MSESPLQDITLLKVDEKMHIVTLDQAGQISVYSPEESKVLDTFAPDGAPT